ncbi:MAG: cupin domain-containing protein [Actinobacteria bacterium]|nr:cupin domain-containing protein [Actinomycetota bacterium]
MGLAHWDDVERHDLASGEISAVWQMLGDAAGIVGVGVHRVRVAAGKLPTPPHSHGASEEVFFVLGGSGLAWQDGAVHDVRPGDCVIQRAREHVHTFVAGPDGLDYLVFGTRLRTEIGWLPRSRAVRMGRIWLEGRDDDPWGIEATAEPLELGEPAPRPPNILNINEVELDRSWQGVATAPLATTERSVQAGFHWERLDPGATGAPPHCHSEEEEVFVILEGEGTLELWPSPTSVARGVRREDMPVHAGHVIARPPGTRIGHAFRAGSDGLTMLIYGTRRPNDMCYYHRSNKIAFRGLGVIGRIENLDYLDGEPAN